MKVSVDPKLKAIISDKISGSSELLLKINIYLQYFSDDPIYIKRTVSLLKVHFAAFQNIQKYLTRIERLISKGELPEKFFQEVSNSKKIIFENICRNSLPFLNDKRSILTISNSRTVFEILRRIRNCENNLITVCESRPRNEGRILARKLLKEKIKVRIITEAMAAEYVDRSDCVLIGADTILQNGNVINKAGSLQLALLARYFGRPFYVAADKSKFGGKKRVIQRKESTSEIWRHHPEGIKIENLYFEEIPIQLITKIISE